MPLVISVSHPEEEVEVDVEEGGEKEEASEPRHSGDEEPSTSAEHTKQEVRKNACVTLCICFHVCMKAFLY